MESNLADPDGNVIVLARGANNASAAPDLRALAKHWLRAWQGFDMSCIDDLHATDSIDHAASGRSPDNAGFKQGIVELCAAFPDFCGDADDIGIDGGAGKATIIWNR